MKHLYLTVVVAAMSSADGNVDDRIGAYAHEEAHQVRHPPPCVRGDGDLGGSQRTNQHNQQLATGRQRELGNEPLRLEQGSEHFHFVPGSRRCHLPRLQHTKQVHDALSLCVCACVRPLSRSPLSSNRWTVRRRRSPSRRKSGRARPTRGGRWKRLSTARRRPDNLAGGREARRRWSINRRTTEARWSTTSISPS